MSEILAPAGDKNCAYAAINAGADAIYLGLKNFSARASAENFGQEEFAEICDYAHALGVKVYVAMNTLVKDRELADFISDVQSAVNAGADAIIISDVFLGKKLKAACPELELHLSTQAGVCNEYGARLAKEYGFDRVILARETAFADIKKIAQIIETETFIQGALCTCFSGQCYFSSFAGGNSGNRGRCKQPCRKIYSIDRQGYEEGAYRLSLSDLRAGENINTLKDAGVYSFKIEGRMRRPEYVASAVRYYRKLLQGEAAEKELSALKRAYNRGNYTAGLAFGQDKSFLSPAVQGHIGEFVGAVKVENGKYVCESREKFSSGDGFKILRDGKEVCGAKFGGEIKRKLILSTYAKLKNGDKVFITTDEDLNKSLISVTRKTQLRISACFQENERARIDINGKSYFSDEILAAAQNRPLTRGDIENCFKKTDKYPFEIQFGKIECGNVFMPASALNAFRRRVYEEIYLSPRKNHIKIDISTENYPTAENGKTAVICADLKGVRADIGILKPSDYSKPCGEPIKDFGGEKFLYLPPYLSGEEVEKIKPLVKNFDGIYCDGIYGYYLAKELEKPFFAGTGLNISNAAALSECNAKYVALSKEINCAEAKKLARGNVFYLTAGNLKVMDLIYCPFGKKCSTCDRRGVYTLTDENGRKFPLRRYEAGGNCRFEVYNCAELVSDGIPAGALADLSLEKDAAEISEIICDEAKLKSRFKNYTRGHSANSVI